MCQYCKGTGKITLLFNTVDCDCQKTVITDSHIDIHFPITADWESMDFRGHRDPSRRVIYRSLFELKPDLPKCPLVRWEHDKSLSDFQLSCYFTDYPRMQNIQVQFTGQGNGNGFRDYIIKYYQFDENGIPLNHVGGGY